MFQRLKGAFDSLAEEQSQLRAAQAPSRRPNPQLRSSTPRLSRQKSDDSREKLKGTSGPDPDPSLFDPEKIEPEADASTSGDSVKESSGPTDGPVQVETSAGDGTRTPAIIETESQNATETAPSVSSEPGDVQAKLRKLNKLEGKYQELLKAYRKAHARNSFIEPFEARLREHTPLTSISDPDAFVEYLVQLNTRADLAMDELKKVTNEKEELKRKLAEAERQTKDALDEVTQLRQVQKEDGTSSPPPESEATVVAEHSASPPNAPRSSFSLGKRLFSPSQQPVSLSEDASEEMFSVDNEVPRLQAQIGQLETQNEVLKGEIASATESAEKMMQDLERTQKELETLKTSSAEADEEHERKVSEMKNRITELDETLEQNEKVIILTKAQFEKSDARIASLEAELQEARAAQQVDASVLEDPNPEDATQPQPVQADQGDSTSAAKKKKKKNKKKKTGAEAATAGGEQDVPALKPDDTTTEPSLTTRDVLPLSTQSTDDHLRQLKEKDEAIDRLQSKIKSQEDLKEEIETLKDELINVAQETVDANQKVKQLQQEKETLQSRVVELEQEIESARANSTTEGNNHTDGSATILQTALEESNAKADRLEVERITLSERVKSLEGEIDELKSQATSTSEASTKAHSDLSTEFEELKAKSKSLETELSAAQQLAASRYKEMTSLRELLQKAQPELVSLRTEVSELKTSRDDLASKNKDLRKLELREETLRSELESIKRDFTAKESEIKTLNQRINQETTQRINLEETNRKMQRDLQRNQTEKSDAISAKDTATRELDQTKPQLEEARAKVQQLERQVEQLTRDTESLRDEISLKTAQHASAESLMTNMRDQTAEMAAQMKEAKERCESLEDELTDAHRLMSERGREGETMRRLLSEVEARAESRVKDMRERLEIATQERDRAEEEASTIGRRRTREVDDLKTKLREAERDLKHSREDHSELQRVENDLRKQKEDDKRRIGESSVEIAEVRKAMGELRDALDDGEKQVRDYEVERSELKRSIEEIQQRCDKLQKSNKTLSDELRSLRATRIRPTDSPSQSSRSSFDSSRRVTSPPPSSGGGGAPSTLAPQGVSQPSTPRAPAPSGNTANVDYVYLKNVLLQFVEQKDKSHQMQLVPVLSMLLRFDKKDEQKWLAAISGR